MFEEKICPYPGLRPFNDDESIFFKGREKNIDTIIELFEKKKFMMLTGASGDGKSSLIYAGVIPHARAGLFKAKYNNWAIADFRPERDPLGNLTGSLNKFLKWEDADALRKELSNGFSALINAYKKSPLYLDLKGKEWLEADDAKKKLLKRKASNLLIVADQFEEFFTNTENYINGSASVESQITVNLLLETARMALAEDIPIYVICTMRSDYIGQCAAFRGLPEYIGYSQFFVPRLKRNEIQQVIEEPAVLNGDKISRRLSERLLNDITVGYDQLPILQHALNQLWKIANNGKEEIDLIHYSMVGGLPKDQLPEGDKKRFEEWFEKLPEFKQKLFEKPSLENILNAHADELFETAREYYISKLPKQQTAISPENAKQIIKTAFQCLTKIDESRAVRNRMTLEEITNIIDQQNINNSVVGAFLNIFRLQGNTFLKPFLTLDNPDKKLSPNDILDITHESLIRNWGLLDTWAKEEHENWLNFQDFDKQLKRWINSGKDKGYLLPIGPLTFFENWYTVCKPNKHWLARYDERELPHDEKLKDAENTIQQAKQFLKLSARKLFFTRTILKYGANTILACIGVLVLSIACTYYYFDFESKQNPAVLNEIQIKSQELLKSKFIKSKVKADYILTAERLNPGTYKPLLKETGDDSTQAEVLKEMFVACLNFQEGKKANEPNHPMLEKLFWDVVNLSDNSSSKKYNLLSDPSNKFKKDFDNLLHVVYGHSVMRRTNFKLQNESGYRNLCGSYFVDFISLLNDTVTLKKLGPAHLTILLQAMPDIVDYDTTQLKKITALIDPFNLRSKSTFDILYPKELIASSTGGGNISHNGGYYQLANLFALTNNFEKLNKSFDSLITYNKGFISNETYGYSYNRLVYDLIITDKFFSKEGALFIAKIESAMGGKNSLPVEILTLNNLSVRSWGDISYWTFYDHLNESVPYFQMQKEKISHKQINELADKLIEKNLNRERSTVKQIMYDMNGNEVILQTQTTPDEKYFTTALLYKTKAFINNKTVNFSPDIINASLKKAFENYDKVSPDYLNGMLNLGEGTESKSVQRFALFKYPSLINLLNGDEESALRPFKLKNIFIDFAIKLKGFDFYNNVKDAEVINRFLLAYISIFPLGDKEEKIIDLKPFEEAVSLNKLDPKIDRDALLAFLTVCFNSTGERKNAAKYSEMINYAGLLNKEKINKNDNPYQYYNLSKSLSNYWFSTPNISEKDSVLADYLQNDEPVFLKIDRNYKRAFDLIKQMPDEFQRRNTLIANIDSLQRGKKDLIAVPLLDTLINSYLVKSSSFGNKLFEILGRLNTGASEAIALNLMKDKSDIIKPECLKLYIQGLAQSGNYYKAVTFIPDYVSSSSQLSLYTIILKNEAMKLRPKKADGWPSTDYYSNEFQLTGPYENGQSTDWVRNSD